jgi:hypothetical protein
VKSNATKVLALVNRGRAALGKAPLKRLPNGYSDDELEVAPIIARALEREIWPGYGIAYDAFEPWAPVSLLCRDSFFVLTRDRGQAQRLAAAWKVGKPRRFFNHMSAVFVPPEIRRFITDFNAGKYPELDRAKGLITITLKPDDPQDQPFLERLEHHTGMNRDRILRQLSDGVPITLLSRVWLGAAAA